MRIEWPGNRCILCLDEISLSREHLILKALGGILICSFLCKKCNSILGYQVDAEIKKDPRIRFAVDNLESYIPNFAHKFREGQEFVIQGPVGPERGKIRAGKLQVNSRQAEDGSLIQPPDHARESIKTILQRDGINEVRIQETLRRFDEAGENEEITLTPGRVAVKWTAEKGEPYLRGSKLLTPLFPLKIGYEFLALLLGTAIYKQDSALDDLRDALRRGIEDHPSFQVELLNASEYRPFHGIGFVGNSPHAIVLIRLFGWLAFRVHFRRLAINHPSISYLHSLDTNQDDIQLIQK